MPSTFSTNLGLELPATGEQSGTWGTTVNLNTGTLLEQAISGFVGQTITDGADTVITIPDGATGVARNMVIQAMGTLSAERNLVVPAKRKLYFIFNSCNYAITVKCAGQTGESIPAGKKVALFCDGTDIELVTNYMFGDITGNAATVTNGLYSNQTYPDPAWLTTLSASKLTGTVADARLSTNVLVSTQSYADPVWLTQLSPTKLSTAVPVANGGTGASSATSARSNLGLGTMATQNSSAVSISGGTVATSTLSGTTAIANGGTGSSTGGGFLRHSGASAVVTYSTGAEPTGADGDIHLTYI